MYILSSIDGKIEEKRYPVGIKKLMAETGGQ
jgi:hypothetical protein